MHRHIASQIVERVSALLRAHDATFPRHVHVGIGELSGVDIAALSTAYQASRQGTVCCEAALEIRSVSPSWSCRACGQKLVTGGALQCPDCWEPGRLDAGDEIVLERVDAKLVERDDPSEALQINVWEPILASTSRHVRHNREVFARRSMFVLGLMGLTGAGKTTLLRATAAELAGELTLAAVIAEVQRAEELDELDTAGVPSTRAPRHDQDWVCAETVQGALHKMPATDIDVLFVEQQAMSCLELCDVGQHRRVIVVSVEDALDTVLRYRALFRGADLVLLSKVDLLSSTTTRVDALCMALARVMPKPRLLSLSTQTGEGLDAWADWILSERALLAPQHSVAHRVSVHPASRLPR